MVAARSDDQLHTCSGFGWVKFDPQFAQHFFQATQRPPAQTQGADEVTASTSSFALPEVRCLGFRLSQPHVQGLTLPDAHKIPHGVRRSGSSSSNSVAMNHEADTDVQVPLARPLAIFCAGRMSTIRPAIANNSLLGQNIDDLYKCAGLSFRVEEVDGPLPLAESSSQRVGQSQPATDRENAEEFSWSGSAPDAAEGLFLGAARGVEAISSRAGAILSSLGQGTPPAPLSFASDTVTASKKICFRAGKIVERMGTFMLFPFRSPDVAPPNGDAE